MCPCMSRAAEESLIFALRRVRELHPGEAVCRTNGVVLSNPWENGQPFLLRNAAHLETIGNINISKLSSASLQQYHNSAALLLEQIADWK